MDNRRWFVAAGVHNPEIRHLRGHARLGWDYTLCGKLVAFDVVVRKEDNLRGCKSCWKEEKIDAALASKKLEMLAAIRKGALITVTIPCAFINFKTNDCINFCPHCEGFFPEKTHGCYAVTKQIRRTLNYWRDGLEKQTARAIL